MTCNVSQRRLVHDASFRLSRTSGGEEDVGGTVRIDGYRRHAIVNWATARQYSGGECYNFRSISVQTTRLRNGGDNQGGLCLLNNVFQLVWRLGWVCGHKRAASLQDAELGDNGPHRFLKAYGD